MSVVNSNSPAVLSRVQLLCFLLALLNPLLSCQSQSKTIGTNSSTQNTMKHDSTSKMPEAYSAHLSEQEYDVLVNKATDRPGEGGYTNLFDDGTYHCRACGAALYTSSSKFHSGCGWPSFDTEIPGSVSKNVDRSYGMVRTEIVCANCGGHLGHVFEGEHYTATNTRHCVNTSSILFHPKDTQTLVLGMGPFHEAQAFLQTQAGVLYTEVGYANSETKDLHYDAVESGQTNAVEVVRVQFDPKKISLDTLIQLYLSHRPAYLAQKTQHYPSILCDSEQQLQQVRSILEKSTTGVSTVAVTSLNSYQKAEMEHQNFILRQKNKR